MELTSLTLFAPGFRIKKALAVVKGDRLKTYSLSVFRLLANHEECVPGFESLPPHITLILAAHKIFKYSIYRINHG